MHTLYRDDQGVSPIVAALLLILITVIAAAGLAMIVSQAEKQQADRQALDNAIKNENLKIVSILPEYYDNGSMKRIKVTIQNLNIDDAKIGSISINNIYAIEYHCNGDHNLSNDTKWTVIPASNASDIEIGFNDTDFRTPPLINNTDPINIQVSTSYYNYFERTFKPPIAIAKFSVETDNLRGIQSDYVMLDASDSNSDEGHIIFYNWTIKDGANLWNPINPINTSGKKVRFDPPSIGPFKIVLTVVDNNGLIGNSQEFNVSSDIFFYNEDLNITSISPAYYDNQTIKSINLNIKNLNVKDSYIKTISINDINVTSFYGMLIPATQSIQIPLELSYPIYGNQRGPIRVQLNTMQNNTYTYTFNPPIAVAKYNIGTESIGQTQRDYITLDASDSSSDSSSIVYYNWTITDLNNPSSPSNGFGKILKFNPYSNGPFTVNLTIKDSNGMLGEIDDVNIPEDPNFNPPVILNAVYDKDSNQIIATVLDGFGKALNKIYISFIPDNSRGNVQVALIYNGSNSTGVATTNVQSGTGIVKVSTGQISREVLVN